MNNHAAKVPHVIVLDLSGLGRRIARYRKMNRLTAEGLAALAGDGVSRSLIAKLESGHRADLQVGQFVAIAWALRVPLSALLLPIDRPFDESGPDGEFARPVRELTEWMNGRPAAVAWEDRTVATGVAGTLIAAAEAFNAAERRLSSVQAAISVLEARGVYENAEMEELERARIRAEEDLERQQLILGTAAGALD